MTNIQLSPSEIEQCLKTIMSWRTIPSFVPECPLCHKERIEISDHSSRPHTEWYRLICKSCGLDNFFTLPIGSGSFKTEG